MEEENNFYFVTTQPTYLEGAFLWCNGCEATIAPQKRPPSWVRLSSYFILFVLLIVALLGGCIQVEPVSYPAAIVHTQTVSAIHSQVAGTMLAPALAPATSATPSAPLSATANKSAPVVTIETYPTEVSMPTALPIPTMVDVPLLKGYKSNGSRVLAQPVAIVRDGIIVMVEQVAVYAERVELVYTVRNIPNEWLFKPVDDDVSLSCGGPASYPILLLPDGKIIYPESYLLDGKARGMLEPYAGGYLIHLFRASIPAGIKDLTMYLNCLELARLDRAPQHWNVPFRIVPVTGED